MPVIAKADCLTKKEIAALKIRILDEIAENGIKIYSLPDCDSDEDEEYKVNTLNTSVVNGPKSTPTFWNRVVLRAYHSFKGALLLKHRKSVVHISLFQRN